jgi:hypothetical protein
MKSKNGHFKSLRKSLLAVLCISLLVVFIPAALAAEGTGGSGISVATSGAVSRPLANLHATSITANSITMAWNAYYGAAFYRFYCNHNYEDDVWSGTSYTMTGLSPDTVYNFIVFAAFTGYPPVGDVPSDYVDVRTSKIPLTAPQNLRSTATTANSITMAWNSVSGASYYRFYKAGAYVGNVNGTSYTCTGLSPDTVYGFKVAAVNSAATVGPYCANVNVRTQKGPLAAPGNLHSTSTAATSIAIAWNSVTGASYYRVYQNGSFVKKVTGASYTSVGLDPCTVYGFKVAAVSSEGTLGAYTGNVYIKTQKLPAPPSLRAATVTADSIKMFWNTVSGASYYRFYLNGNFVGKTANAYYTCTSLTSNTLYGFKVVAVDKNGTLGAYSGNVNVRTK